jgi:hypothetical protein
MINFALAPGEMVVNFFRTLATDEHAGHYIFLTNSRWLAAQRFGQGEVRSYRYEALRGLSLCDPVFTFVWQKVNGGEDCVCFAVDGGQIEVAAFLLQLTHLWEQQTRERWEGIGISE